MTLKSFESLLREQPREQKAIVCNGSTLTYGALLSQAEAEADRLRTLYGADLQGRLIPFRAEANVDFMVRYCGIHMAGGVAVPLDKALPNELMTQYEALAEDVARKTASEGKRIVPEGTADVLYTTGTTGKQKGVMISHRAIVANAENLIAAQGFASGLTFVVCGPLNHIGSLSKIYPTLMVGGTVSIVDGLKDLDAFFCAVEEAEGRVATFMVPASIRMLMTFGADRMPLLAQKMEFLETGAAAMAQSDMEALCKALPQTRLYNTYASTETGIVCTHNFNAGPCTAGCLGPTMKHATLRIVGPDGQTMQASETDGRVTVSGPMTMTGYLGDPELTAEVLTTDGVVMTRDMAHWDAEGRLILTGRADDVINIGGFKVAPTEVEDAALSVAWVKDCVCVAAKHMVLGTALKLIVQCDPADYKPRLLAQQLSQMLEPHKVPMLYERTERVERTFNGKINRKAYKE